MKERILFLGPADSPLIRWLTDQGEIVHQESRKITIDSVTGGDFTFLVSYGYRHLLDERVLRKFPNRAINLHISYLPWNRGSDPNFWSFVEATPKGVTIHYLDKGIDTGDIIVQRPVHLEPMQETLQSSYRKLHGEIQLLFMQNWLSIKSETCSRTVQKAQGTTHKSNDKNAIFSRLPKGYDTPISELLKLIGKTPLNVTQYHADDACLTAIHQNKLSQ